MTRSAADNPTVRYEEKDFSPRPVVASMVALLVALIISAFAVAQLFWGLADRMPLAEKPVHQNLPYAPVRPDVRQWADHELEAARQRASTYGWVDRSANIAHIPVGRAMDLLLQEGLPEQPSAAIESVGSRVVEPSPSAPPVISDPRAERPRE